MKPASIHLHLPLERIATKKIMSSDSNPLLGSLDKLPKVRCVDYAFIMTYSD